MADRCSHALTKFYSTRRIRLRRICLEILRAANINLCTRWKTCRCSLHLFIVQSPIDLIINYIAAFPIRAVRNNFFCNASPHHSQLHIFQRLRLPSLHKYIECLIGWNTFYSLIDTLPLAQEFRLLKKIESSYVLIKKFRGLILLHSAL